MTTATKTTTDHPNGNARAIADILETVTMTGIIGAEAGIETIEAGEMTPATDRAGAEMILLTPDESRDEIAEIAQRLKTWTQDPERYVYFTLGAISVRLT